MEGNTKRVLKIWKFNEYKDCPDKEHTAEEKGIKGVTIRNNHNKICVRSTGKTQLSNSKYEKKHENAIICQTSSRKLTD